MDIRESSDRQSVIIRNQRVRGIDFVIFGHGTTLNPLIRIDLFFRGKKYINLIYGNLIPLRRITDSRYNAYGSWDCSFYDNMDRHYFINFKTSYDLKGNDRIEIYNYGSIVYDNYQNFRYGIEPIISDGGDYEGIKRIINNEFPVNEQEVKLRGRFEDFVVDYNLQVGKIKNITVESRGLYKSFNKDQQFIICDLYSITTPYVRIPKNYLRGITEIGIIMDGTQTRKVNWTYVEKV